MPRVFVRNWVCDRRRVGLCHRRGARSRLLLYSRRWSSGILGCGLLMYWSEALHRRFVAGGFNSVELVFGLSVPVSWFFLRSVEICRFQCFRVCFCRARGFGVIFNFVKVCLAQYIDSKGSFAC
ncbi:hypothetical protein A2U01_0008598, partial [Trifolium medium]|nr:hypothetical protein [Trifolium medium]